MFFLSSSACNLSVSIVLILAAPYLASVLTPACQPVREITGQPIFSIAIASKEIEICSPVESNISISRFEAFGLISLAFSIRSSVVSPCAETATTTLLPALYASVIRLATFITLSASLTEVPPYF